MQAELDQDLLDELIEMFENGAGSVEIWEYIEDNTDQDPCLYIQEMMY